MTYDERTERNIATLLPKAQELARNFMALAVPRVERDGWRVKIISGHRTYAEQDRLYAQGRTTAGPVVTKARGGYSNHNFGVAFDVGLFKGGVYVPASYVYVDLGRLGESVGLEWGGRWKSFPDFPHYQVDTGLTLAQMRKRVAKGVPVL
jgi:peptidoglycan L-alanyl-D-glutamate endopeptidase CwlK